MITPLRFEDDAVALRQVIPPPSSFPDRPQPHETTLTTGETCPSLLGRGCGRLEVTTARRLVLLHHLDAHVDQTSCVFTVTESFHGRQLRLRVSESPNEFIYHFGSCSAAEVSLSMLSLGGHCGFLGNERPIKGARTRN